MRRMNGDGVELAVSDTGDGPPVLLLHGFPDTAALWRHQIPALTAAGLRTIAPDLRGFGESDKPADASEYRVGRSVADLVAILDALGIERARVAGHDWGAGDWALMREWLASHPEREAARERLARPGALTAALNWYRANVRPRPPGPAPPSVGVDTLGIWSSGDRYLLEEQMKESGAHVDGTWRYERIDGAGHWMQLDAPDRVSELLVEFLADRA